MKVSTENDNNFGYEKITIVVDNMPLSNRVLYSVHINGVDEGDTLKWQENASFIIVIGYFVCRTFFLV